MDTQLPVLLCAAAPAECDRIFAAFDTTGSTTPGSRTPLAESNGASVELLATGVGPTSAGVSAAASLAHRPASSVIAVGIAGAYPNSGVGLLETVLSTRSILAGEGRAEAGAFIGLGAMGFGPFDASGCLDTPPKLVERLAGLAAHRGPVATVSAVSGTDALAAAVEARTGAFAEAMEGAAIHLACHRVAHRTAIPFAELRVISNIVGDREHHPWKLAEALDRLGGLALDIARVF